jgi:Response regulator containing CheY-like receiver, AAA-type ATPase, and DNA-binding domains
MMNEKTVLVVDDDPNILSAFGDFFRKEECRMIASSSTEDALEILKESSVNLIITDIRLKGRSGVTFLLEVKRTWQNLPVIVISGYPDVITETDLQQYGADYFFVKPLDLEKLREAVRQCLRRTPRKS